MSNPYAAVGDSVPRPALWSSLRFLSFLVSWLIALAFLGHGVFLAGEYLANNGFGPPTRIAKSVLDPPVIGTKANRIEGDASSVAGHPPGIDPDPPRIHLHPTLHHRHTSITGSQ